MNKCHLCKKRMWFWQDQGFDDRSHIRCYRDYVKALWRAEWCPKARAVYQEALRDIREIYGKI